MTLQSAWLGHAAPASGCCAGIQGGGGGGVRERWHANSVGWGARPAVLHADGARSEARMAWRFSRVVQQRLERRALLQVVSAAGAVDHSQLVQLAEKAFSGLPSSGPSSQELVTKAGRLTPD